MEAIVFEGHRTSYDALWSLAAGWRRWLEDHGVGPGARVGVLAHNRPETIALLHACSSLGAALVPFNARLTAVELAPLIAIARPTITLSEDTVPNRIPGARPFEQPPPLPPERWMPAPDPQPLAALFTSGTTGRPTLIELTHGNFRASARASGEVLGASSTQRWLSCLPLFHVGGLAMAHRCAEYGATLVLERGFDPQRVSALIDAGVTHASLVPNALERLLEVRDGRPFPVSLEAVLVGGGPVPAQLMGRARSLGAPVLQTYGLTEACSQVATERPGDADGSTAGPPLPGLEVRITAGQIEVRGPTVAPGFGPWLPTHDLGRLDERGRLVVLGRRTDLIVSGGENVYPAELEATLAEHPQVREVAVAARADPRWGQVPVALVVWRAAPVPDRVLVAWARSRLAGYKIPRVFLSVDALPRNATGKIDRARLRDLVA